jgi:Catalytic LigB subunit of aromatic ring-opening dioxygenase
MGTVMGVGVTHFPPLSHPDHGMASALRWTLEDPAIPDEWRDPANWPQAMRDEWDEDGGEAAAAGHRAELVAGFARVRKELAAFGPDALLIVGDDQYENFREDLIPPYALLAYDDQEVRPWHPTQATRGVMPRENIWGEGPDTTFLVRGRRDIALYLAERLLDDGFDAAYAYKPLHHPGIPHAFMNTLLYLDYDRTGFDLPIIPLAVNCYGRRVVSRTGGLSRFANREPFDPPSPSPRRLMDLGAGIMRALVDSPWRVALIASSSWSHAFLCDSTWRLRPDTAADRRLYEAFVESDWGRWRTVSLGEIEAAGQQELLNWFVLAGAMEEGQGRLLWSTFIETRVFNTNKVFACFDEAPGGERIGHD